MNKKSGSASDNDSYAVRDIEDEEFLQNLRRKMSINSGDGGSSSDGDGEAVANDADAVENDIADYTRVCSTVNTFT